VDFETAEAIDRLSDRIDAIHLSLGSEVADVRSDTSALRTDMTALRTELAALRTELHQGLEDGRRYALMLNESTAHDIRLVAGGVAALAVKIDSLHR
jgi:hypothetical protein